MTVHQEIEQILASYRDASQEERARAEAHIAACAPCAARLAAYEKVDTAVAGLRQPALPPRLAQPFSSLLREQQSPAAAPAARRFVLTPALASAAAILLLLVALSVLMWAHNSNRAVVTLTPTLTTTLTPTTVSARQTEPAAQVRFAGSLAFKSSGALMAEPTPGPVPVPVVANSPVLLAGYAAHATISH